MVTKKSTSYNWIKKLKSNKIKFDYKVKHMNFGCYKLKFKLYEIKTLKHYVIATVLLL